MVGGDGLCYDLRMPVFGSDTHVVLYYHIGMADPHLLRTDFGLAEKPKGAVGGLKTISSYRPGIPEK